MFVIKLSLTVFVQQPIRLLNIIVLDDVRNVVERLRLVAERTLMTPLRWDSIKSGQPDRAKKCNVHVSRSVISCPHVHFKWDKTSGFLHHNYICHNRKVIMTSIEVRPRTLRSTPRPRTINFGRGQRHTSRGQRQDM